jgi:hypothetical protein
VRVRASSCGSSACISNTQFERCFQRLCRTLHHTSHEWSEREANKVMRICDAVGYTDVYDRVSAQRGLAYLGPKLPNSLQARNASYTTPTRNFFEVLIIATKGSHSPALLHFNHIHQTILHHDRKLTSSSQYITFKGVVLHHAAERVTG